MFLRTHTKHLYLFDEVYSSLQKSIRRGLLSQTLFFAGEFLNSGNSNPLWNRLFVILFEDIFVGSPNLVHPLLTLYKEWKSVLKLNKKLPKVAYECPKGNLSIIKALKLMCQAYKSREICSISGAVFSLNNEKLGIKSEENESKKYDFPISTVKTINFYLNHMYNFWKQQNFDGFYYCIDVVLQLEKEHKVEKAKVLYQNLLKLASISPKISHLLVYCHEILTEDLGSSRLIYMAIAYSLANYVSVNNILTTEVLKVPEDSTVSKEEMELLLNPKNERTFAVPEYAIDKHTMRGKGSNTMNLLLAEAKKRDISEQVSQWSKEEVAKSHGPGKVYPDGMTQIEYFLKEGAKVFPVREGYIDKYEEIMRLYYTKVEEEFGTKKAKSTQFMKSRIQDVISMGGNMDLEPEDGRKHSDDYEDEKENDNRDEQQVKKVEPKQGQKQNDSLKESKEDIRNFFKKKCPNKENQVEERKNEVMKDFDEDYVDRLLKDAEYKRKDPKKDSKRKNVDPVDTFNVKNQLGGSEIVELSTEIIDSTGEKRNFTTRATISNAETILSRTEIAPQNSDPKYHDALQKMQFQDGQKPFFQIELQERLKKSQAKSLKKSPMEIEPVSLPFNHTSLPDMIDTLDFKSIPLLGAESTIFPPELKLRANPTCKIPTFVSKYQGNNVFVKGPYKDKSQLANFAYQLVIDSIKCHFGLNTIGIHSAKMLTSTVESEETGKKDSKEVGYYLIMRDFGPGVDNYPRINHTNKIFNGEIIDKEKIKGMMQMVHWGKNHEIKNYPNVMREYIDILMFRNIMKCSDTNLTNQLIAESDKGYSLLSIDENYKEELEIGDMFSHKHRESWGKAVGEYISQNKEMWVERLKEWTENERVHEVEEKLKRLRESWGIRIDWKGNAESLCEKIKTESLKFK